MTISLIGIAGYARAGKDTMAGYLEMRYGFKKVAFADPIREALIRLNPYILVQHPENGQKARMPLELAVFSFGWEALKSLSPDVRPLLQRMGSEVGREMLNKDIWVNRLFLENVGERKLVISDVRYQNEAEAIRNRGGEVWLVERKNGHPANGHESENDLRGYEFDRTFINSKDEDFLFDQIDMALVLEQGGM